MPEDLNPLEEDIKLLADEYVAMVEEFVEELAPSRPWWSKKLSADEKLWRWMDVREEIVSWLVETGAWMGWQDYDEVMKRVDELWFSMAVVDIVPPEVLARVPLSLVELVQANPKDAGPHIRDMERIFHRRREALDKLGLTPAPLPEEEQAV